MRDTLLASLEADLGRWVITHRWWVISVCLVVVAIAASGMRFLSFDRDNRIFISEQNPQFQALEALENTYVKNYNLLFILAPRDGGVFSREALAAVEELTEAAWQIPYSSRVDSITNFQYSYAEQDDLIVEDLVSNSINLSDSELQRIKSIALAEPALLDRLISSTGEVTGVNINILLPGKSPEEVPAVAEFARQLAATMRAKFLGIDLYLSGTVMLDNAFGEVAEDDMTTLLPVMFIVLTIITGLALRSLTGTFVTVLVIVMSTVTGLGLAGCFGMALNPASGNAPTIILTLAVADSVHILVSQFHKMHEGRNKFDAITESLKENLDPVFLTSATTVIGFLTMKFSDSPPFRELGNIVAMGITAAFFYSVLFLPAMMAVLPVRTKARVEPGCECECECCSCDRLAGFVLRYRNPLFWLILTTIIMLAMGITRIEFYDDFVEYFGEEYDIRKATDYMEEHLTGADMIEYSLYAGEPGGISKPEYLARIESFADWFRQQPEVVHVDVITDIMKRLSRNMHGDDDTWYRIPERRDLAAQYLLLYEMSLPYGLDLNNQINVDKSASRMTVILKDTTTSEQRALEEKGRAWLKANAPESMFTYGSGLTIIFAYISQRNITQMLFASFGALIVISFILMFALGSIKHGLISLAPNLAPALVAFGIWGLLVGQVGLGLSVIVSMTLGIVVDDTVHFLSKYLHARRKRGMGASAAVRHAFNTVGTAMWITTVALVAGFLVLVFSGYKMNSDMGLMTAITITLALIMDFLFLPCLLMRLDGKAKLEASSVEEQGYPAP